MRDKKLIGLSREQRGALREMSVTTLSDLMERIPDLQSLAKKSETDVTTIETAARLTDFSQIDGLNSVYGQQLLDASVHSIHELADADAKSLLKKLAEAGGDEEDGLPDLQDVEAWIVEAQDLAEELPNLNFEIEPVAPSKNAEPDFEDEVETDEAGSRTLSKKKLAGLTKGDRLALKKEEIQTNFDLIKSLQSVDDVVDLSRETDVGEDRILQYLSIADLSHVSGINGEYAKMLIEAGVKNIEDLSTFDVELLLEEIKAANEEVSEDLYPSFYQLDQWITEAGKLTKQKAEYPTAVIEYSDILASKTGMSSGPLPASQRHSVTATKATAKAAHQVKKTVAKKAAAKKAVSKKSAGKLPSNDGPLPERKEKPVISNLMTEARKKRKSQNGAKLPAQRDPNKKFGEEGEEADDEPKTKKRRRSSSSSSSKSSTTQRSTSSDSEKDKPEKGEKRRRVKSSSSHSSSKKENEDEDETKESSSSEEGGKRRKRRTSQSTQKTSILRPILIGLALMAGAAGIYLYVDKTRTENRKVVAALDDKVAAEKNRLKEVATTSQQKAISNVRDFLKKTVAQDRLVSVKHAGDLHEELQRLGMLEATLPTEIESIEPVFKSRTRETERYNHLLRVNFAEDAKLTPQTIYVQEEEDKFTIFGEQFILDYLNSIRKFAKDPERKVGKFYLTLEGPKAMEMPENPDEERVYMVAVNGPPRLPGNRLLVSVERGSPFALSFGPYIGEGKPPVQAVVDLSKEVDDNGNEQIVVSRLYRSLWFGEQ